MLSAHSPRCASYYVRLFPRQTCSSFFFFFNDTATTEIYTLSLHDALPIYYFWWGPFCSSAALALKPQKPRMPAQRALPDRKSTRLNSSHSQISYAVFCLKKKKQNTEPLHQPRNNRSGNH